MPTASPSPAARLSQLGRLLLVLIAAGGAGWLFERLNAPLPWMIGPLVATALISISGWFKFSMPDAIRPFGQVVVACQVGLTFSPAAFALLLQLAPVIVGTALMTGLVIFGAAILLSRMSGLTLVQAFLAGVPTSPVEAASMAMRAGVDPMPVILSQTLRMSAVVLLVPFGLYALEGWPEIDRARVALEAFDPLQVLLLAAIGVLGAVVFRFCRVPNPNFLGPLTLTAALAVSGFAPLPYPGFVLALAQIVLGTWLGARFRRELLGSARRLLLACAANVLLIIILSAAVAVAIAAISGIDWHTMILGAAPGGVAEMALTAKFLGQNVALITAFHLTRIFIFMPNIPWIVALIAKRERRAVGIGKGSGEKRAE